MISGVPTVYFSMALPQGDLALLDTETAQRLLASTIPARYAYTGADGTPRIVPSWHQWTGSELVMPTFFAAPHIARPAARIAALRRHPDIAVTIDTEGQPPEMLLLRGPVTVTEVDGVDPDYARAAERFLGDGAVDYLAMLDNPITRMARIALTPTWAALVDFESRLPAALGGIQS
jgi:hypothetical protein